MDYIKEITSNNDIKIVSFDLFDTLFKRAVLKPIDVFKILEDEFKITDFRNIRRTAEREARMKIRPEITYDEIYEELKNTHNFDNLDKIKQREIELELELISPIQKNKEIYDFLEGDYKIVYTTDMYLPSYAMKKILAKCGYNPNNELFISGEHGFNKITGKMYEHIIDKHNIKPEELLHIGDNYHSDILKPTEKGIHTYYVQNTYDKSYSSSDLRRRRILDIYNEKKTETIFLSKLFAQNYFDMEANQFLGYTLGPLIYYFTKWVLDNTPKDKKIIFNMRDGFLPYKIATEIFGATNCELFYSSRKSVCRLAIDQTKSINDPENTYAFNILKFNRCKTISQLLEAVNIDANEHLETMKKHGFDSPYYNIEPFKHNGMELNGRIEKLLIELQDIIYDHTNKNKENFLKYFNKFDIKNGDTFCDIGYNGSIQYSIEQATGLKLKGLYLDCFRLNEKFNQALDKRGFLPDGEKIIKGFTAVLETFLTAPIGSAIGYTDTGEPILQHDPNKLRKDLFHQISEEGILEFCKDWHKLRQDYNIELSYDLVVYITRRFLYNPTFEEVEYGMLEIFENGHKDYNETLAWFDIDEIKKGKIKELYARSYWKTAFLALLDKHNLGNLKAQLLPPPVEFFVNDIKVRKVLKKLERFDKPFMLYGAGALAVKIMEKYKILENPNFKGFIDKYKNTKAFKDQPVYKIEEAYDKVDKIFLSILAQDYIYSQIEEKYKKKIVKLI